jgi:hypothetical protein
MPNNHATARCLFHAEIPRLRLGSAFHESGPFSSFSLASLVIVSFSLLALLPRAAFRLFGSSLLLAPSRYLIGRPFEIAQVASTGPLQEAGQSFGRFPDPRGIHRSLNSTQPLRAARHRPLESASTSARTPDYIAGRYSRATELFL